MPIAQDSTDPTGVAAPHREHAGPGNNSAVRARERKANAALGMALGGATWDEIAEVLGFPTARAARVATELALEAQLNTSEDRDKMRAMAGARLERMIRSLWTKAIDPDSPEQMAAQREVRANIAQHAKLFGLDAPTEYVVHSPTQAELDAWVTKVVSVQVPAVEEPDIFGEESHALPAGS